MVAASDEPEETAGPIVLLSDNPVQSIEEDRFSQHTFVTKLVNLLESNAGHFNIGIFGKWGTGKTGILNMLQNILKKQEFSNRFDVIYVDAWKLSEDSLRQQLLYEFSRKYKPEESEEAIEDKLFHTIVKPIEFSRESIKESLLRILALSLPYLIIAAFLIWLGVGLEYLFPGYNLATIISSLFVVPLAVVLAKEIAKASKALKKSGKKIIPKVESPFQFAKIFRELIEKKAKEKKLIVAIDNLDRCESELVFKMLSTIKTFMETDDVFFVVACDDAALIEHLEASRGFSFDNSRDFIRKFFQVSITIPPFIPGDLTKYTESLTEQLQVPITEDVKDVLITASIDNPRRIKVTRP